VKRLIKKSEMKFDNNTWDSLNNTKYISPDFNKLDENSKIQALRGGLFYNEETLIEYIKSDPDNILYVIDGGLSITEKMIEEVLKKRSDGEKIQYHILEKLCQAVDIPQQMIYNYVQEMGLVGLKRIMNAMKEKMSIDEKNDLFDHMIGLNPDIKISIESTNALLKMGIIFSEDEIIKNIDWENLWSNNTVIDVIPNHLITRSVVDKAIEEYGEETALKKVVGLATAEKMLTDEEFSKGRRYVLDDRFLKKRMYVRGTMTREIVDEAIKIYGEEFTLGFLYSTKDTSSLTTRELSEGRQYMHNYMNYYPFK
jgi:uncharacterized protein YlzI (FlbEa/FlbD family)